MGLKMLHCLCDDICSVFSRGGELGGGDILVLSLPKDLTSIAF